MKKSPQKLSHYDATGRARMVDVSTKPTTQRTARAHAFVKLKPRVLKALPQNPKGDPLEVARIAGILAAKKTSDLIPMCHPLALSHVDVELTVEKMGIRIENNVWITRTGNKDLMAKIPITVEEIESKMKNK